MKEDATTKENTLAVLGWAIDIFKLASPYISVYAEMKNREHAAKIELREKYGRSLIYRLSDPDLSMEHRPQLVSEFENNLEHMNRDHKGAEHLRSARGKGRSRKVAPTVKK